MKYKLPLSSTNHEITATAIVIGLDNLLKNFANTQNSKGTDDPKAKSIKTNSLILKDNAYICWLKHNGNDVIGIFPKWHVQLSPNPTRASKNTQIQTHTRTYKNTLPIINSCLSDVFRYTQSADVEFTKAQSQNIEVNNIQTTNTESNEFQNTETQPDIIDKPINEAYDIYNILNQTINEYISSHHDASQQTASQKSLDTDDIDIYHTNNSNPAYTEGLMGYIGYDLAAQAMAKEVQYPATDYPQVFFGHYDMVFRYLDSAWHLIVNDNPDMVHFAKMLIAELDEVLSSQHPHQKNNTENQNLQIRNISNKDKESYHSSFHKIQDYLKSGDCYQVNLAQQYTAEYSGNPTTLLPALEQKTNAPYAGYIALDGYHLISCSPELFVEFKKKEKNTIIMQTKPIKGTLPRLEDDKSDKEQIKILKNSQKNLSENLMIVDLLRNDFSIFAKTGSVNVPKLFEIESYPQVHHMVSTITADLSDQHSSLDVFMQSLPGGSITGAPKIRAIEIIAELEKKNRGAYCGSMGFINFDGTGSFNILIRTVQLYQNKLNVWAGGGITIASDANEEYQECLDKISGILDVLRSYERE